MGPSTRPEGTYNMARPLGRMMKAPVPSMASKPMPPGLALSSGGLVAAKSGTSAPVQLFLSASQKTYFLRSDHGVPSGLADARLYMIRRLAGQAKPQPRCVPGLKSGSGLRLAGLF